MKKRILSIFLAMLMLVSLLPVTAFATTTGNFDPCNGEAKMSGAGPTSAPAEAPEWGDYIFAGWYDARTGGDKVTGSFDTGTTYYAHWWTNEDEDTLVLTEGLLIGSDGNLYVGNASSPVSFTNPDAYGLGYSSGALTMNDAVIDTCDGFVNGTVAVGVLYQDTPPELTIELTGNNVVLLKATDMDQTRGVDVTRALTLDGTGSLTVTAGEATSESYGVHSSGTLTNKATLTATAGDAAQYSSGVQVSESGSNIVNNAGAELNAFGGNVGKDDSTTLSTGVRCEQGNLTNSGTLNATAGTALTGNKGYSYGVYCDKGNLTNNGELKGTAVNAINNSGGVYCAEGTVTNAEDAKMTGISGNVSDKNGLSVGIYSYITLTNAGEMTGTGGKSTGNDWQAMSAGIYCCSRTESPWDGGDINNSGTMVGTGGESPKASYGIRADYWLRNTSETGTITGIGGSSGYSDGIYVTYIKNLGTMSGTGGTATDGESYGIEICGGSNDGLIIAKGGTGELSYGLYAYEELTNSASITATGGTATEESYGLKFEDSDDLTNSAGAELTATGGEVTGEDGCSYGVYSESDCVTNSGTLTATGGEITNGGACSYGIYCMNWGELAALTNSGTLTAKGGTATGTDCYSYGIYVDSCTLTNNADAELFATGGAATFQSVGVFFAGVSLTNNGTLTAKADEADSGSIALDCIALLTNGAESNAPATITAIASDSAAGSIGIYCRQAFPLVNYGTLTAETGNGGQTYGVQCEGEIKNYGIMKITAGDATLSDSLGVYCEGDLTNGTGTNPAATLTAKAGNSTASDSTGVMAMGTIYNYGALTGTAGDASESSLGVVGQSSAAGIENYGTLTGRAGAADASFGVIVTNKDLTVHGGAVISYGDIKNVTGDGYIIADGAVVSGANDVTAIAIADNSITSLTQSNAPDPIIIALGAIFDPCNGDPLIASLTTAPAPAPTKDGYDFDGWYTAADGGSKTTTGFTKGTIYYAHWKEVSTPSSGGGSSSYAITVNETKNGTFTVDKKSAYSGSTVTITVAPDKGFTLETLTVLDKNGKEIEVKNLGNNKFSFKMPSGKVTVSATFMEDNTMLNFFVDVKVADYFYDAVLWAAENDITKGTDDVHFSPNMGTTRAQVVTFLWRAAGMPVVNYAVNMSDVKSGEYYSEAVRWALSEGITKGTSDTTFSPDAVCTRGQIVTFLARFAGVEDADTASAFTDVKSTDFFAAAVKWAKDNKVTEGTSATTFSPNTDCTRAQVVTFLYRWMVK